MCKTSGITFVDIIELIVFFTDVGLNDGVKMEIT